MLSNTQNPNPELISGRYRVEAELGHGGMARVYRVLDERSGHKFALKRLVAGGELAPALRAMFEHEYHTLVQLAHPRIVRVFDYGVDEDVPYYTMELLEGADARHASRDRGLSVRETCILLRDAASALALVHSRRMVHRDVSPRNLWCTPDGHATLIDFGTLVAMGPQARIAGTPPFVPPEAVYMQPLDARCDLYALGALAYFLLTKRHAYPAREIADLRQAWQRRPRPPDAINPELPAGLSDLVMAMLSLDPRGRPAFAAEICERLTAIAELPVEDERRSAQAFLTSPKLVGREQASAFLRKRLLRALRGRGSTAAIMADAGLGRSRMLESFVLEAKLMGAVTIAVDARAVGSGSFALAGTIAERLLAVLPMTAAAVVDSAPVLAHVSPAVRRALGEPSLAELTPFERTLKLSAALVALVDAALRHQRVVITVDDVHRADGPSLGFLARLSLLTNDRRLLLVTSCDSGMLAQPPPALEQLIEQGNRIELTPLDLPHTQELLGSLFGSTAGLEQAALWLHELSQGSPQTCMQYAQYLVDQGIACYEGGQWQLPQDLRRHGLPTTLAAMFEGRVAGLSDDARALALGIALARDESRAAWQPENSVSLEDYPKLLDATDGARTFLALDELLQAGVLQQRDNRYVLGQRAMVDALLRVADDETRRLAHGRLAQVFEHGAYQGTLLTVRQLQLAGEHARARERLIAYTIKSGQSIDWGSMRVSLNAECAQIALEHWRTHGGSPLDGVYIRRALMVICSVYDWSLARFGEAQVAQLRVDCGLHHFDETDPTQPALNRMFECLTRAQQAYDQKPESERGLPPFEAVREIAAVALSLSGAFANAHDAAHARAVPGVLAPLRALSPVIALLAEFCDHAIERVTGRELGDRALSLSERLAATAELPAVLREGGAAVFLHQQAVEDSRLGRRRALELVERLAPKVGDEMFLVLHPRWLGYAFRGEAAHAQRLRKQLDAMTEDDVWRRKACLFVEAQLHALTGDLSGLHGVREAIAELTQTFDGWKPWLAFAEAATHRLRGQLDAAEAELAAALRLAPAGEHCAWIALAPAHAEVLLLRGDFAGALHESDEIVANVEKFSLDRSAALAGERVRALAQSALGQHEAALESIERAFVLSRLLACDGLPLAQLYEAQARVSLAAGQAHECMTSLTRLRKLLENADAPALVRAYETLREESVHMLALPEMPAVNEGHSSVLGESTALFTEVQTQLNACSARQERAQRALELLLEASGAQAGYLFLFDAAGLFDAASKERGYASAPLLAKVQAYLDAELRETKTEAVTVADVAAASSTTSVLLAEGERRFMPVVLSDAVEGRVQLIGLALLLAGEAQPSMPRAQLVIAISRCLEAAGDSTPVALE